MSRRPIGSPIRSSATEGNTWSDGGGPSTTAPTVSPVVRATVGVGEPAASRSPADLAAPHMVRGSCGGGWYPVGARHTSHPTPLLPPSTAPTVDMEGGGL